MARGARIASVIGLGLGSVTAATLLVWVLSSGGDDTPATLPAPPPPVQYVTIDPPAPPPRPPAPALVLPPADSPSPLYVPLEDDPPAPATGIGGRAPLAGRTVARAPVEPTDDYRELVHRELERNTVRVGGCYQLYIRDHPDVGASITVTFDISLDGLAVVKRSSSSGLDDEAVVCIGSVFRALRFPSPAGNAPVRMTYPFTFQRGSP